MTTVDPLFLTAARVSTFLGDRGLTNASGFFFERDKRLYWFCRNKDSLP